MPRQVTLIGMGAVGTHLASQLEHLSDVRLQRISVRRHLEQGFNSEVPIKIGGAVLLCCKAYQLKQVGEWLTKLARDGHFLEGAEEPQFFFLQNGFSVFEEWSKSPVIRASLAKYSWVRGVVWFGANKMGWQGGNQIEFAASDRAHWLYSLLELAGFEVLHSQLNVEYLEWKKALPNLVINPLCSWLKKPNGILADEPELEQIWGKLLDEAWQVALNRGVRLEKIWTNRDRARAAILEVVKKTAPNQNSMLQDLNEGRSTELNFLSGRLLSWTNGVSRADQEDDLKMTRWLVHQLV